jgi:hypothetical protein
MQIQIFSAAFWSLNYRYFGFVIPKQSQKIKQSKSQLPTLSTFPSIGRVFKFFFFSQQLFPESAVAGFEIFGKLVDRSAREYYLRGEGSVLLTS